MKTLEPHDWPLIPRGTAFEDHVVGRVFDHHWGRTIHGSDNIAFSTQMLAFNPMYFNRTAAVAAGHPDEVVNPLLVFDVVFGLSVEDLSEAGGPFLGASAVEYIRDVYPGQTLTASSTVVDARKSASRTDAGIVTWETLGRVAADPVIRFRRTNLVRLRAESHGLAAVPDGFAEDFVVGARFRHARTRTITDLDLNGLTLLVMNTASGHFSEQEMAGSAFGGRINFGGLTLALTVGLATQDTSGQSVREIGLDDIRFAVPVRHGDTVGAATEVLAVEPIAGGDAIVSFRHFGMNQHGDVVCEVTRKLQVRTRSTAADFASIGRDFDSTSSTNATER
ncbi:MaoC family dehydratase [Antrihabitans sp. YC2-6]|uniref:MaoC family dehydratase n=1 Tax=Antrihabitans sp. YC2-6 TaxID=2799498 RepID=UPI0018F7C16C|nr:MaoC family dehydratase [Antrihabitans sp. YC2-6]MBJ8346947.1 MaoC family dehydratase [Antrihabitans sp. YC2-6]